MRHKCCLYELSLVVVAAGLLASPLIAERGDLPSAPATRPTTQPSETAHVWPRQGLWDDANSDPRSTCYLFDVSTAYEPRAKAAFRIELLVKIGRLRSSQEFNIIFCGNGDCTAVSRDHLLPGTAANRSKAMGWLYDVRIPAKTDPIAGIELALQQKPAVLYFVTDHAFTDGHAVARKIAALNKDHTTVINTIALVTPANPDPAWGSLLFQIAGEDRRTFSESGTFSKSSFGDVPPPAIAANTPPVVVETKKVFDDTEQAERICFVCDASGSMINKMFTLKNQLLKTIDGLKPTQSFNMVFMQDAKYDSLSAYVRTGNFLAATPGNRAIAKKFLEGVTTTGSTDPIPALQIAFKQNPQVIYLLTDGDFPDNDAVLQQVRRLNREQRVRIYTISFVGDGDNEVAFLDLLKKIAAENRGHYKNVRESEF